jgi:adenylate cyclase class 2
MSERGSNQETEIKLRLSGAAEGRRLLRRAGFSVARRRELEKNTLFDTAEQTLRAAGMVLRLRQCGRRVTLTFKGPAAAARHKSREELELEISGPALFAQILARLGFEPVFRYQKYRTEYSQKRRRGLAMLDETPIGSFLELEGEPEWIDRTAAKLGFSLADQLTASYAGLYLEYRKEHPRSPEEMVFTR